MGKLVVSEYMTLDGTIDDPGGGEKSAHGGWSFQFWSEEAAKYKFDELFAADAFLLGRKTYQGFAAAWPSMKDDVGFADRMNNLPKFVVSTTLQDLSWNNSTLLTGTIADGVARLKQQFSQDIVVAGSGMLAQALMQQSLVDEYRLMLHPIVVGGGSRLFREGLSLHLQLVETKPFASGVVVLIYRSEQRA